MLNDKLTRPKQSRYFPKSYFKIQCFTDDPAVRDLLTSKYPILASGDSSVIIAVSERKIDSFMEITNKFSLLITVKDLYNVKKRQPIVCDTIIDTLNFDIPQSSKKQNQEGQILTLSSNN